MINSDTSNETINENIEKYRKEANAIFYDLNRQLLVLATFVISLSPALAFSDQAFQIIHAQPIPYVSAILLCFISLLCGIFQLFIDWDTFRKFPLVLDILLRRKNLDFNDSSKDKALIRKFSSSSSASLQSSGQWPLLVQGISLLFAFGLIVLVILQILYSNPL